MFTDSFNFAPGASGSYPFWFSGPQGIMTASLNGGSYGGLNQYAGTTGWFGWGTSIFDVYTPRNYTLHFVNNGTGNVTARVANGAKPGNFLT